MGDLYGNTLRILAKGKGGFFAVAFDPGWSFCR